MARPYFTARHLESMALLPDNLEIGRAYFVDDEQVIVIDHGRGPVVYGKSPGPQGIAGEPIPQLQDQINSLAEAELTTQRTIWDINERELQRHSELRTKLLQTEQALTEEISAVEDRAINAMFALESRLTSLHAEQDEQIQSLKSEVDANLQHSDSELIKRFEHAEEMSAHNAEAITTLIETIHEQFQKYDSALSILAKSVAELYPEHYADTDSQDDPLDNETIYTDAGAYTIQQTILKDGTVVLNLTPQEQVIDSLKAGDSVDFDGSTWLVEDISTAGGTTTITIRP
ncbi:MAG: hypothetical protein IJS39_02995 [Synergistaceae bacterium]|nr:hypothetical protein [Synergistaceae bacterium]